MYELEIGKKFGPHPNLKKVYYTYLGLAALIPLIVSLVPIFAVAMFAPAIWRVAWGFLLIPLTITVVVLIFAAYWIQKYYGTISFELTGDEVVVERGVWWKMRHVVPYGRVMSIDLIQGPLSRRFGVGAVQVHTAGYTGPAGGTAGPGRRGAEANIWGVQNFVDIRDTIMSLVRGRPLFGAPRTGTTNAESEILKELREIRKALVK